ncbi:MAG: DUF2520 domain-containing protein [Chloroflexi bacterium]|nr:DUF2520 domain-containing protein [Chloroflexota bacterium]
MAVLRGAQVGFVGAGAVGTALARAMARRGYRVTAVASLRGASARRLARQVPGCSPMSDAQGVANACEVVFITTPDDIIAQVAGAVRWRPGQAVVHCSGALGLEPLAKAQQQGAVVGIFHPLQTFSGPGRGARPLKGIAFALEAQEPLAMWLRELAHTLGGWPITLAGRDWALYHVAAVAACGFVTTLVKLAADCWGRFEGTAGSLPTREEALRALLPLVGGTVKSLERNGLPKAFTGPVARGDVGTLEQHLAALQARSPEFLLLYCHLALAGVPIAVEKRGITPEQARQLEQRLTEALAQSQAPAPAGPVGATPA